VTCFEGLVDPEILEDTACCEAFSLASELYLHKLRVATYCKSILCHLKEEYLGPSIMIILEIQSRLRLFAGSEIVHEGREANFEVYDLTKAATMLAYGCQEVKFNLPCYLFFGNFCHVIYSV
jgi:hypothetical protein